MKDPGLDDRHRDKSGQISWKNGNTLVGVLRKIYGVRFGSKFMESDKLSDVLHKLDAGSLSQLHNDHDANHLERKIKSHS